MGNVPPAVELLFFQEDGVSIQTLVNYGPFRYHLLVERNYDEGGCQENALLEKSTMRSGQATMRRSTTLVKRVWRWHTHSCLTTIEQGYLRIRSQKER
jgi:hypothetical protein